MIIIPTLFLQFSSCSYVVCGPPSRYAEYEMIQNKKQPGKRGVKTERWVYAFDTLQGTKCENEGVS